MSDFRLELRREDPFERLCPICRRPTNPLGRFIADGNGGPLWICDDGHACSVPISRERSSSRACSRAVALPLFLAALLTLACSDDGDEPAPPHPSFTGATVCASTMVHQPDCVPPVDAGAQ